MNEETHIAAIWGEDLYDVRVYAVPKSLAREAHSIFEEYHAEELGKPIFLDTSDFEEHLADVYEIYAIPSMTIIDD